MSNLAVVIRADQRHRQLPVLIRCFPEQTDPRWTLYVVHDGPDPAHAALMEPFVQQHPDIRYAQTAQCHNGWGNTPTRGRFANGRMAPATCC